MRKALLALALLFTSCNCASTFFGYGNPDGSVEDQIRYHQEQIRKYKTKVTHEEHNAQRSLSRQDMSDVKRANQRKAKYVEKIEEHAKELERLKVTQRNASISLVVCRTEVQQHQDLKNLDSEISSVVQLKEYYIRKAGRARERSVRLRYQGYLHEAEQKLYDADEYDAIVKKLEDKLGDLQLQRDDFVRRTTTLPQSKTTYP